MSGIELRSSAFNDHTPLPDRHALGGENISPSLEWSGVAPESAELLLLCEDPDAPPGPFLHWLVTGINPTSTGVGEGDTPPGGLAWPNDFGEHGWTGPQPPPGERTHRYYFRLYALREAPRLPANPTTDNVHAAVDVALACGTLVGLYQR